jgi:hypothetical protein
LRALIMVVCTLVASGTSAALLDTEQQAREAFAEAQAALAEGRLDQAEILLERVLMLMPEHAEARIDFSLLMWRRGQADVARALLTALVQDPRTPVEHRQRLQNLMQQWGGLARSEASAAVSGPGLQGAATSPRGAADQQPVWRMETQWAYSSNPLARTSADGITLSLSEGPVTLPVSSRPVPGNLLGLALQRFTPRAGLDVAWQQLQGSDASPAYRLTTWGPLPSTTWHPWPWGWTVSAQRGFDGQRRHTLAVAVAPAQQRYTLAVYHDPDLPDRGGFARLEQHWRGPWPGLSLQAGAEVSRSLARQAQGFTKVTAIADLQLAPTRKLQVLSSWQQDHPGYSPLLKNNAKRMLWASSVVLEQQLSPQLAPQFMLRLFASRRLSNLELFRYSDAGLQIVLWRQW